MGDYLWPKSFEDLRAEICFEWGIKGEIGVIRTLSGKSGALVLQVDIESTIHKGMAILKLISTDADEEIRTHREATAAAGSYGQRHFPKLIAHKEGTNGAALLIAVGGNSLHQVQPFSRLGHAQQVSAGVLVFSELLREWNGNAAVRDGLVAPPDILKEWLGSKLLPGSRLHDFSEQFLGLGPDDDALSVFGTWLPNPLNWASKETWEGADPLKIISGKVHGDFHGDNLLVRVAGHASAPYYVIDFSFYRDACPLFYDHAYLEVDYLLRKRGEAHVNRWLELLSSFSQGADVENLTEDVGIINLVEELRQTAATWIAESDRPEHLAAQYLLARVAAGLNFASKRLAEDHHRVLAFLYAASALRKFLDRFHIGWAKSGPAVENFPPVPPPETDNWQEVWEACDHFDRTRNVYVLLSGGHKSIDATILRVIGRIPWSLVIDFDPASKSTGLHAAVEPVLSRHRAVREMTNDNVQDFNFELATAWLFTNGTTGRPDTLFDDPRAWRRVGIPSIRRIAENIRNSAAPMPICVVVLPGDLSSDRLASTWEALDEVFADQASYEVVSATPPIAGSNIQSHNCDPVDFLRGLWLMCGMPGAAQQVNIPARQLTSDQRTSIAVEAADVQYLGEDLTLVYEGLSSEEESPTELVGLHFWRGGEISWAELDMQADVRRDAGEALLSSVLSRIESHTATVLTLEHKPGAGGTTVSRRLLWDLRDRYPALLIHNVSDFLSSRLERLYHLTRLPLLIVAEASIVSPAARENLVRELRARNVRFVLCYVLRSIRQNSSHAVPEPMGQEEGRRFFTRYKSVAPAERLVLLKELTESEDQRRFRTPFFYGLYSFEDQFTHVAEYVRAHISDIPGSAIQLVRILAIVSRFSQEGLLDSIVLKLLGLSERMPFRLNELLGQSLSRLVRVENRRIRFVHPLIAEEILKQLLGNGWIQSLPDLCCTLIERIIVIAGPKSTPALQVLSNLFIFRDFWGEEKERRRQFSELILKVENSAGQHRILKKLVELCPEEAHFWNHLGRHHMYIMDSPYEQAETCLLQAIKWDENNSIHRHALGMAYRFEIKRRLAKMRRETNLGGALEGIEDLFKKAQFEFAKTRELSPTNEHGFITNIQLICEIIQRLFQISGFQDYSRLLGNPGPVSDWCRSELSFAEELLRRAKSLQPSAEYSDMTMTCQASIAECYGRFESMINSLRLLLIRGGMYRAPVRRTLVNAYQAKHKYQWRHLSKDELHEIKFLMEENLTEDSSGERDLFLWFQASRRLEDFDHLEAIDRYSRLAVLKPSVEAYYYLYILYFIRFFQGISEDFHMVRDNMDKCRSLNIRTGRARSYEWLAKEPNSFPVAHESELGKWDFSRNVFVNTEPLMAVEAVIKQIKGPQSGWLSFGHLDIFFVPGTEFLPGRDENATVRLFLGFSYEVLRGWSVSRGEGPTRKMTP